MPPIEKSRRHHAQELRLQATLCSNARSVLSRICAKISQTERDIRGLLFLLPRLARKQQVSGKKMPKRLQASAQHQKIFLWCRDDNCTHPVDTDCSWRANPSLSVRCSSRHQVPSPCRASCPRCHRRRRHPRLSHYSHFAGAAELDNLATPLSQMGLTLARKVGRA